MSHRDPFTGTASTTDIPEGLIAGHLLRVIREHLGLTQETAAERLRVEVNTLRSWETGRRPLVHTKTGQLKALRNRLRTLGAPAALLELFDVALDADLFVAHVLLEAGRGDPSDHMLAGWVSTRAWSDLLAWTLAGTPPKALAGLIVPGQRRGPAPSRPDLGAPTRAAFFDSLRATADRAAKANGDPAAVLLRRQVYYIASWDTKNSDWLAKAERAELRSLRRNDGWTPSWVAARSLAVSRACQGDREQLRHFIANQLVDDTAEAANLNYYAYWIGEHGGDAVDDGFMATGDIGPWRGGDLLKHLVGGLDPVTPYVDLLVHSVWALLGRRPWLLDEHPNVRDDLRRRVAALLDTPDLSPQAHRELQQLTYVIATRSAAR